MLLWLLDKLKLREDDGLVICYNPSYMATGALMRRFVRDAFPNVTLVELQGETRGAAETVLLALEALPEASRARPTMLCDSDTFYTADIVSRFRAVAHNSNACFVFHDTQPKPIYRQAAPPYGDRRESFKRFRRQGSHICEGGIFASLQARPRTLSVLSRQQHSSVDRQYAHAPRQ